MKNILKMSLNSQTKIVLFFLLFVIVNSCKKKEKVDVTPEQLQIPNVTGQYTKLSIHVYGTDDCNKGNNFTYNFTDQATANRTTYTIQRPVAGSFTINVLAESTICSSFSNYCQCASGLSTKVYTGGFTSNNYPCGGGSTVALNPSVTMMESTCTCCP